MDNFNYVLPIAFIGIIISYLLMSVRIHKLLPMSKVAWFSFIFLILVFVDINTDIPAMSKSLCIATAGLEFVLTQTLYEEYVYQKDLLKKGQFA